MVKSPQNGVNKSKILCDKVAKVVEKRVNWTENIWISCSNISIIFLDCLNQLSLNWPFAKPRPQTSIVQSCTFAKVTIKQGLSRLCQSHRHPLYNWSSRLLSTAIKTLPKNFQQNVDLQQAKRWSDVPMNCYLDMLFRHQVHQELVWSPVLS